jgi:hypothetical protein
VAAHPRSDFAGFEGREGLASRPQKVSPLRIRFAANVANRSEAKRLKKPGGGGAREGESRRAAQAKKEASATCGESRAEFMMRPCCPNGELSSGFAPMGRPALQIYQDIYQGIRTNNRKRQPGSLATRTRWRTRVEAAICSRRSLCA